MPRVSLIDTHQTFEVSEGETLYDGLFEKGKKLPHGCLSGSCGACRIEVVEGAENLERAGVIEQNTIEALLHDWSDRKELSSSNVRLACRAKVKGDLTIRIIK